MKKREGLAMGKYRHHRPPRDMRQIKWVKEGEWAVSLGVPVGNDLDHEAFWRGKIKATRQSESMAQS